MKPWYRLLAIRVIARNWNGEPGAANVLAAELKAKPVERDEGLVRSGLVVLSQTCECLPSAFFTELARDVGAVGGGVVGDRCQAQKVALSTHRAR